MSCVLLFAGAFAFFLHAAFPGLSPFRDAGDFASASTVLGVAHPPGYPLYVLLGNLLRTLLPFGNPAYRANVLSGLCGAGCIVLSWRILRRFAGRIGALVGVTFSILYPPLIGQAGLSEVYALNALLTLALLAGAFVIAEREATRPAAWAGLAILAGAGLANHQSLLLAFPSVLLLLVRHRGAGTLHPRFARAVLLAGFAGLSLYLFLPLRAVAGPDYAWGEPGAWSGFWDILTRADYGAGTLSTRYSTASPGSGLMFWLGVWNWKWTEAGTAAGLAALLCAMKKENRAAWGAPLFLLWIFTGPLFALLARLETTELSVAILQPALVVPGLAAALGIGLSADFLWKRSRLLGGAAVGLVGLYVCLKLLPAALGQVQRWNLLAPDYGRNLLRSVPPDSLMLVISDPAVFALDYARHVEGRRADIQLVVDADLPWRWRQYRRRYPELFTEGQADGSLDLVRLQAPRRTIYTEGIQAKFLDALCPRGMAAVMEWPRRTDACLDRLEAASPLWEMYVRRTPSPFTLVSDYYSRSILKAVSSGAFNGGLLLTESGRSAAGRELYGRALTWNPERLLRWSEAF